MRQWTEEQRKAQSEKMKALKPWEKSIGPKSETGKKRVALNALKHGMCSEPIRELRKILKLQREFLRNVR